jgi:hypothetical protein
MGYLQEPRTLPGLAIVAPNENIISHVHSFTNIVLVLKSNYIKMLQKLHVQLNQECNHHCLDTRCKSKHSPLEKMFQKCAID